ncbi:ABC transporter ATP-binding protein [Marmoricola endophyticus]|uniref:ABC transporter ATP-binding protein n=1 Tax=Marmoricola endophyticus TaxID=2040280 RepID=A0A917BMX6_9ACTN|nr:ABC transporter ATP-binding protein [Marmoricola endophyticus]GGF51137.1 ABC transporter ATP-binding protein [Marmoricola endophyticus]
MPELTANDVAPVEGAQVPPSEPRSGDEVIAMTGIQHTYLAGNGEEIPAVGDATLRVGAGEFVSIIGPSGCGKSTLLKIIAGLVHPSAGDIRVQGHSPADVAPEYGLVFQAPNLLPWRNVAANVGLPLEINGVGRRDRERRVEELLELVGLQGFGRKSPRELSGGMQQRVAIARALTTDPPLLLMDEPFGALDAMTREQMNIELQAVNAELGTAVVMVTHSIDEAVFLSDRVVVMSARPSRVAADLPIDLPRPRGQETFGSAELGRHANQVRAVMNQAGGH